MVDGASPIVEVRDLKRTFDRDTAPVRALRGVDLTVAAGEFVAVTGPSGCGKSTLLTIIAGLDVADEGTVVVAGAEMSALDGDARAIHRRTAIGVVFQFFNLLDSMTAAQNVAIAAMLAGATRRAADRRARELLDLLGLSDRLDTLAQHACLAASVSGWRSPGRWPTLPAVLLADEPTGALDTDGGADVLRLFTRLHESGQTIVLVTHDPVIAGAAQRVVSMRDGRVVDFAAARPA